MRGEEPLKVELATSPRLDLWEPVVRTRDGVKSLVLKGSVRGHPSYRDDEDICTSAVLWLDRKHRWARTRGRLYVLEGRAIDMEGI
ncbi:MAG: hypothetical protein NT113_04790 [Hyphomicrobiales bacterium]|nr:hypothetical protein [Hyphomicrobiales bacterium]